MWCQLLFVCLLFLRVWYTFIGTLWMSFVVFVIASVFFFFGISLFFWLILFPKFLCSDKGKNVAFFYSFKIDICTFILFYAAFVKNLTQMLIYAHSTQMENTEFFFPNHFFSSIFENKIKQLEMQSNQPVGKQSMILSLFFWGCLFVK